MEWDKTTASCGNPSALGSAAFRLQSFAEAKSVFIFTPSVQYSGNETPEQSRNKANDQNKSFDHSPEITLFASQVDYHERDSCLKWRAKLNPKTKNIQEENYEITS